MAIQFARKNPTNLVVANYHRIGVASQAYVAGAKGISVNLFSYVSKEARDLEAEAEALMQPGQQPEQSKYLVDNIGLWFPLPPTEEENYSRAQIYQMIMAMPEFAGSVAV